MTLQVHLGSLLGISWQEGMTAALWIVGELMLVGLVATLVGLAWGAGILMAGGRKRHVFWTAPLLNLGLLAAYWIVRSGEQLNWLSQSPQVWFTVLSVPLVLLASALASAVLTPIQMMVHILRNRFQSQEVGPSPALVALLNKSPATTPYPSFREGFMAPWHGFLYLCHQPNLWRFAVWPMLINLLITGLMLGFLLLGLTAIASTLHNQFPQHTLGKVLEVLTFVVLVLAIGGVSLVMWKLQEGILCGFFYSQLAEQVERELGLKDIHSVSFWHQVTDTLRNVAWLLCANVGCLSLNLIPVIGSVLAMLGSLYMDCYIFGLDYWDFPLALRGQRRPDQKAFAKRYQAHTLGLGAVVFVFNFIPIFGSIILTTAVVGSILLHRRLATPPLQNASPLPVPADVQVT